MKKIDVLAELDETVFTFRERAAREGIELIYNVPHVPTPMSADANRIKQVFVNILDNALKYTEQGGKVTVSAEIKNSGGIEHLRY
jgi:signal transduction histidine kinase